MEVRARALAEQQSQDDSSTVNPDHHERKFWNPSHTTMTSTDLKHNQNPPTRFIRKVKHEVHEMGRVTCSMLRCQASKLSYLFIPFFISIFWLVIMLITTRNPNATLEDKYIRDYFDHRILEDGTLTLRKNPDEDEVEEIHLPVGVAMNVVVAIPFLDINPIASQEYVKMLEWILIYSTVPIRFHIITNEDSVPYVNSVMAKINLTSNCDFTNEILTLSTIIKKSNEEICPMLGTRSEFCEILMGNMTPLLFPYLFKDLDSVVYLDRKLVFQDNIGFLYPVLEKLKRSKEGIAMAPEQTKTYMVAFSSWQKMNPSTKIGRPPPNGKPGYNPDLIVMDLDKLRASASYRTFFNEAKLNQLVKNYMFHSSSDTPSLGDMINLMAVDVESLFMNLGCEWNRVAQDTPDSLGKKYNFCEKEYIHVWNGNPQLEKIKKERNSRTLVPSEKNKQET